MARSDAKESEPPPKARKSSSTLVVQGLAASGSPPDWATITVDLACPRCGYNLRMLTVARCPECGLHFSWEELVRAAEDVKNRTWTFDCQWPNRPFGTFFQTIACCLLPWKIWTRLPLSATPRVGPLLLMIPATVLLVLLLSAATDLAWHEYLKLFYAKFRGQRAGFPWSWTVYDPLRHTAILMLLFVPLWLAIQVFQQTIARYRIRQIHILRILVFTWISVVLWPLIIEFGLNVGTMPYMWWSQWHFPSIVFSVADMIPSVVLAISFGLALSTYLKVRGGWLWAVVIITLATALVTALGVALSVLWYDSFLNPYWDAIEEWTPLIRFVLTTVESAFHWLHGLS